MPLVLTETESKENCADEAQPKITELHCTALYCIVVSIQSSERGEESLSIGAVKGIFVLGSRYEATST